MSDDTQAMAPEPAEQNGTALPAGDAPPGPPEVPLALLAILRELKEGLNGLRAVFDNKLREDRGQQQIIDRLHGEVQAYRADLVLSLLRPLAQDLIRLRDDLDRVAAAHRAGSAPAPTPADVARLLDDFQATVEDVLARYGFEPFQLDGPAFDGKQQESVKSVPTDDPARNRQVAQRLRKGFRYRDRVVRRESVTVYVYQPSPETQATREPPCPTP